MQTDEEIGKVAAAVPVIICILLGAGRVEGGGGGQQPGVALCGLGHHPAFSLTPLSSGARAFPGVTVEEGLPSDPVPKRQDHDHVPPVSGSALGGPGWGPLPGVHTLRRGCALIVREVGGAGRSARPQRLVGLNLGGGVESSSEGGDGWGLKFSRLHSPDIQRAPS